MCGICGYAQVDEPGLLERMVDSIRHRGPDDSGCFARNGIGLGHTRLSIIDLAGGHQPIENEDGSVVVICNGEIYNHKALRAELEASGHRFRTRSDTEVLVHLYEEGGPMAVKRCAGMFTFALYDIPKGRLVLARDRVGIKPLYVYRTSSGGLLFASELKAILRSRDVNRQVDTRALLDYLWLRHIPGPRTLVEGVEKFPAGHIGVYEDGRWTVEPYWQPELYAGPYQGSEEDYLEELAVRFESAVSQRLMADVPFGAYLSGGLDSSLIVAAMARQVAEPVRTFSVGFDFEYDERKAAAATAARFGCEHTEIVSRPEDIRLLPEIIYHLDEPLGDPIVIPMYRLAQAAKEQVTVILAGEGADEVWGGYLFHKVLHYGVTAGDVLPAWGRRLLGGTIARTPERMLNLAFNYPAGLGHRGRQKVADLAPMLSRDRLGEAYHHLISLFDGRDLAGLLNPDLVAAPPAHHVASAAELKLPVLTRAAHMQFASWLPELILNKQDKVSMASGVEVRVPFLDHELVEFGLRVPPGLKVRRGSSKYLLRQLAKRYLPAENARRWKMPFYVPLERYISHPVFQEYLDATLSPDAVANRGIFRPEGIRELRRKAEKTGEFLYAKQLFSIVALELWYRNILEPLG